MCCIWKICIPGTYRRKICPISLLQNMTITRLVLVCLQGTAFSLEERLQLGTHGLLPPCFVSQDVQLLRVLKNYDMRTSDLDR